MERRPGGNRNVEKDRRTLIYHRLGFAPVLGLLGFSMFNVPLVQLEVSRHRAVSARDGRLLSLGLSFEWSRAFLPSLSLSL